MLKQVDVRQRLEPVVLRCEGQVFDFSPAALIHVPTYPSAKRYKSPSPKDVII